MPALHKRPRLACEWLTWVARRIDFAMLQRRVFFFQDVDYPVTRHRKTHRVGRAVSGKVITASACVSVIADFALDRFG